MSRQKVSSATCVAALAKIQRAVRSASSLRPTFQQRSKDHRYLRALWPVLSLCIAGLAPGLATASDLRPAVYETGYEILPQIVASSIYWLDNERLLFAGMKAGRGPRADLRKLYVWEAKNQAIHIYADAKVVCYSDGFISYRLRIDKAARTETVREGPVGSEKEIVRALPPSGSLQSQLTCRTYLRTDLRPEPHRQHLVAVLRGSEGYLDLGPHLGAALSEKDAPMRNLVLYRAGGKTVRLPITWDEGFLPSGVAYSVFKDAYILVPRAPRGTPVGILGPWPKGEPLKVYLLHTDGSTESVSIPYFPSEHLGSPKPTRAGWLFGGGNFYRSSGLYLFHRQAVSKLDIGLVKEVSVSPDGCRAAVAIQNDHLNMGTPTNLKVMDFCAERP